MTPDFNPSIGRGNGVKINGVALIHGWKGGRNPPPNSAAGRTPGPPVFPSCPPASRPCFRGHRLAHSYARPWALVRGFRSRVVGAHAEFLLRHVYGMMDGRRERYLVREFGPRDPFGLCRFTLRHALA